jgi:hypothetical protein
MFANRVMQVKFVNPSKTRKNDTSTDSSEIDWDVVGQKAAIAQETAETIAKVVITAYVVKKIVDTACQIAVIAAEAKIK